MELYPAEIESLETLLRDWVAHREYELEAGFGVGGAVDATTFLNVAQRLKAKGYVELQQEDYMNILTPDNVRFTLTSMRAIQEYCRDNILEGKPFSAMIKDRSVATANLDISDYDVRIKSRRENPLELSSAVVQDQIAKWATQKKAFRLIRRWTFQDIANGIRVDMSIVRSTPKLMIRKKNGASVGGDYKWQLAFLEHDITKEVPSYEIEVELLRDEGTGPKDITEAAAAAKRNLVRGVGEILRGIQKHTLLIRKGMKTKVLAAYAALAKTDLFRGVAPITLVHQNMTKAPEKGYPNIRTGYNVTDKADGLRVHAFTSESGELYMIDMSMNVYRTGLRNAAAKNALMDGEWVTRDIEGRAISHLLLFDAYIYKSEDISQRPFAGEDAEKKGGSRYGAMVEWVDTWNEGDGPRITAAGVTESTKVLVSAKIYRFGVAGDVSIFREAKTVLSTKREYYTDGLIFTPNKVPIPTRPGGKWEAQLKWKPAHDSTVDFLVRFDKDEETGGDKIQWAVKEEGKDRVQYKSMRLYVGSDKDITSEDPRGVILFEQPWEEGAVVRRGRGRFEYRPVLFNPQEYPDTMANRCYKEVELDPLTGEEYIKCERSGDPIQDNSIVEMMYEPANEAGWRWVPIRVRYDKTERLQRGEIGRTMNKDDAAENVWISIHKPVTEGMITSGREQPLPGEGGAAEGGGGSGEERVEGLAANVSEVKKVYYARKATVQDIKLIEGLRDFHNEWIKERILLQSTLGGGEGGAGGKTLVDLACGQGGDIFKWLRQEPRFCLGIDVAGFGITDPQQGAYARYLKGWKRNGRENMPTMVFAIGSSSRRLITGDAGATPEEADILRSVFGQVAPQSTLPPYVEKSCAGALRAKADVTACMFAFHYFFESKESLEGVLQNIRDTVKVGGYFIGCCFDGKKVFDALRGVPEGGSLIGMEKSAELWKITKRYSATDFINGPESLGLGIDVEFISIGTENREYLVNFDYVVERMRESGLDLMSPDECRALGLRNSTALFEDSYEMARVAKKVYPMSAPIKQYSFFNRWFIFKRRRGEMEVDAATAAYSPRTPEFGEGMPTLVEAAEAAGEAPQYSAVTPPEIAEARYRERLKELKEEAVAAGKPLNSAGRTLEEYLRGIDAQKAVAKEGAAPVVAEAEAAEAEAAGKEGAAPARTLPTEAPAVGKRAYAVSELYQFYYDSAPADRLKIGDPTAARWLDPSAPSEIVDKRTGKKYPSMEHFLAAMKYQLASNKPELGANLFSSAAGTVHRKFREMRAAEAGASKRVISAARDQELLKQERAKVIEESKPSAFKRYVAVFDDALWNSVKDGVIEGALQYRWENDARFRKIVGAVRDQGLILLYYTGNVSGSNLGGVRRAPEGYIDGENRVGRILMRIAGFSGF